MLKKNVIEVLLDRKLKPFYPQFLIGRHVAVVNESVWCFRCLLALAFSPVFPIISFVGLVCWGLDHRAGLRYWAGSSSVPTPLRVLNLLRRKYSLCKDIHTRSDFLLFSDDQNQMYFVVMKTIRSLARTYSYRLSCKTETDKAITTETLAKSSKQARKSETRHGSIGDGSWIIWYRLFIILGVFLLVIYYSF